MRAPVALGACAIALLLVGCQTTQTGAKSLLAACDGYSRALSTLAFYRGSGALNAIQIRTVNRVRAVVNPVCRGEVNDTRVAIDLVERELLHLVVIKNQVEVR